MPIETADEPRGGELATGPHTMGDPIDATAQVTPDAGRQDLVFGPDAWDARHRVHAEAHPAGDQPSPVLAEQVASLPAGTVLDAGAGTGADACWLAGRGCKASQHPAPEQAHKPDDPDPGRD
ncbi:hypothetical protein [Pseudofrankia sp. DC12]|uniref:hypothetical protein n=1 Tax=Pseudofrankia sp. DC12 TaxID=683315 RepID=UPI0005F87491|nr:hypothetical protein [Pseudofrankia sp. DC12]